MEDIENVTYVENTFKTLRILRKLRKFVTEVENLLRMLIEHV